MSKLELSIGDQVLKDNVPKRKTLEGEEYESVIRDMPTGLPDLSAHEWLLFIIGLNKLDQAKLAEQPALQPSQPVVK